MASTILVQASPEQLSLIKANAPNFTPEELMCPCCGLLDMSIDLLTKLQALRNYMKMPLKINSGFRCPKHNAQVHGKPSSRHIRGQAVDISLVLDRKQIASGTDLNRILHRIVQMSMLLFNGIGMGDNFIHCDVRETKGFWHY